MDAEWGNMAEFEFRIRYFCYFPFGKVSVLCVACGLCINAICVGDTSK